MCATYMQLKTITNKKLRLEYARNVVEGLYIEAADMGVSMVAPIILNANLQHIDIIASYRLL